jgi:SAM-dependent methyltransferase
MWSNFPSPVISDGQDILLRYPSVKHVRIEPFVKLPFKDNAYDVAYSNAVVEHVGNLKNQINFIQELVRVSRKAFIIVPNRWFPIEHHTCLPLMHYLPKRVFRSLLRNTKYSIWSKQKNLNHISNADLENASPHISEVGYAGIGVGVFASNVYAFYKK